MVKAIEFGDFVLFNNDGERFEVESGDEGLEIFVLAGEPLNEPVVKQGPYVMTNKTELLLAYGEYINGKFWPRRRYYVIRKSYSTKEDINPPIGHVKLAYRGSSYTKLIFTCLSKANAILHIVLRLVLAPFSIRAIVDCGTPDFFAKSRCVNPAASLAFNTAKAFSNLAFSSK